MMKVNVYNFAGQTVDSIELNDQIFGIEPNLDLLHRVVVWQNNNERQGTVKTKTRAEVRGGGRKPWRQKGTGRARQGSIRSPQWVGGGLAFGPRPRCYRTRLNKKMRRLALKSALSSLAQSQSIFVLDELKLNEAKTREMAKLLKNLELNGNAILVMEEKNEDVLRAARNIPGLKLCPVNTLNVRDLLKYGNLVVTRAAVQQIEEVYA
ncbi:MAG: 50S ribosomal protein L4 [Eubacteriales bacterium]|nr:50S ribosomal protein L4 [Eubacteriales bacterium]